jgi:hypothetical protein|tara:strand:- start:1515 stop:2207 length:693 start_codon:yes stop_codon:yes gene_type:complete
MANKKVYGTLYCSDGTEIALLNAAVSENNFANIQTSTIRNFTVNASDIGTAFPGKSIVASSPMIGEDGAGACYILRAGQIINVLPVGGAGVAGMARIPLRTATTLLAGDQVQFMPINAGRVASFAVHTNQGRYHIFQGTVTGAETRNLVSILTGNSIGDTLQGSNVIASYATSVDGAKLSSSGGGVYVLSDKNEVVGAQPCVNTMLAQPMWMECSIPIGLNFTAVVIATA